MFNNSAYYLHNQSSISQHITKACETTPDLANRAVPQLMREGMMGGPYFDAYPWFVALHEEEIIGACLCAVYPEVQEAWVRRPGIAKKWQRHRVGRALMLHALREFYRRGHNEVRIGVEADRVAHRLYEQVGMRIVQQYDEYQKGIG